MHGSRNTRGQLRFNHFSALLADAKIFAEQCLRGARSKADQHVRLYHAEFGVQPRTAGFDFGVVGLLMYASLSTLGGRPFEMLYHVGDVDIRSGNTRLNEGLIEQFARRADERMARFIFLIPRLLSDQ